MVHTKLIILNAEIWLCFKAKHSDTQHTHCFCVHNDDFLTVYVFCRGICGMPQVSIPEYHLAERGKLHLNAVLYLWLQH